MSIIKVDSSTSKGPLSEASYIINVGSINNLIGEVLTLVEVLGLTVAQEKSIKDLIKRSVWSQFDVEWSYVEPKLASLVREIGYKVRQEVTQRANRDGAPSCLDGEYSIVFTETVK